MDIDREIFSIATREDTSVPGILDQNVRALRKQFDTRAKISELSHHMVNMYMKEEMNPVKVKNILNYIAVEKVKFGHEQVNSRVSYIAHFRHWGLKISHF